MMTTPIPSYTSLEDALRQNSFSTLFLDAYGVFWSGNAHGAFPGSQATMERLFASGKKICILSNSTELSQNAIKKYASHGFIQGSHFHILITSGDLAKEQFAACSLPFPIPNKKYILFCPPHPKFGHPSSLFDTSLFQETSDLFEADFIYVNVPHIAGEDQGEKELFRTMVRSFLPSNKPMLCANPDHYAHEGSPPKMVVRQGSIAALYEEMGGKAFYIGKPHVAIYDLALSRLSPTPKAEILMVGDQPETDIRGARAFGIHAALITQTGIMAERIAQHGKEALSSLPTPDAPDILLERFASEIP